MATPIFELCDDFVNRSAELDPIFATMRGITDTPTDVATDFSPDGVAARHDLVGATLRRLDALSPTSDDDRLAAVYLRERLQVEHDAHEIGEPFRDLRAQFGLLKSLRDSVDLMPRTDDEQWARVAERLAAMPGMFGGWRATLDVGRSRGLYAARRQAVEAAAEARRYAGSDGARATFDTIIDRYGDGPLAAQLRTGADAAHAAYLDLARYLVDEYAPAAPETEGIGRERYVVASRFALGATLDLVDSYEWGWNELYRLEREIEAEENTIKPGADHAKIVALLDESSSVDSPEEYQRWLQEQHDAAIARLDGVHFDLHPALRTVNAVLPPGSSSGSPYYTPPSEDLKRPGRTWWPVGARQRFGVWKELTLVFHEGVPGHHLQQGAARAAGDRLSRYSRISRGVFGHGEGWALYAERLADELGWFVEPGTRLGMLHESALRATRVVVDIGLHLDLPMPKREVERYGSRWTFDAGKRLLAERGRLAPHRIHPEMVRYAGWPAQATAYKLGERAWVAARDEAMARQGAAFDLKAWHSAALALGPIGLGELPEMLRRAG
jgi:uncharacterized protein (DUF885 family)